MTGRGQTHGWREREPRWLTHPKSEDDSPNKLGAYADRILLLWLALSAVQEEKHAVPATHFKVLVEPRLEVVPPMSEREREREQERERESKRERERESA